MGDLQSALGKRMFRLPRSTCAVSCTLLVHCSDPAPADQGKENTSTSGAQNTSVAGATTTGASDAATSTAGHASGTGGVASSNGASAATGLGSLGGSGGTTGSSTTSVGGSAGSPTSVLTNGSPSTSGSGSGGSGGSGSGVAPDPGCGSHKWACWPMPNMPGSGLPNEASYTDPGDGTVIDDVTLLMWQREQPQETYTWEAAIAYCEALSLAGFEDWRLPTRIEITSVLDHSDAHTGWSAEAFPGARGGFHHSGSDWILTITQTGAGMGNDFAWAFNMSDGISSNAYSKAQSTPLRCVRSAGTGEAPSEPAKAPADQYTLVADGEARDNYTGLIWQRGDSDDMLSFQEAVEYCDALGLNGNSWRLPSIRELATLVDEAEVAPAIDSEIFEGTHYGARSNDWYWATPERGSAAWGLNFDDGFTGTNTGSAAWNTFGPSWARCVR